jgi:hypothetical protein
MGGLIILFQNNINVWRNNMTQNGNNKPEVWGCKLNERRKRNFVTYRRQNESSFFKDLGIKVWNDEKVYVLDFEVLLGFQNELGLYLIYWW